ncbi:AAA family ATPase, partial [Pasteurella multocida]
ITMFFMSFFDSDGVLHEIGNIKIGFKGQVETIPTHAEIKNRFDGRVFDKLPDNFISLGQDVDFYSRIFELSNEVKDIILKNLNDVVYNPDLLDEFQNEPVFYTSLMRHVSEPTIKEQFRRVLEGKSPLTDFTFSFIRNRQDSMGKITLEFEVKANSVPSTNIHAIIGRNGVGKTTLLNGMIKSFINKNDYKDGAFYKKEKIHFFTNTPIKISDEYFSRLVAVSFSVFDPFIPNNDEKNYSYIGLKKSETQLKEPKKYFEEDFWLSFLECRSFSFKRDLWVKAIQNLESDNNFAEMNLSHLMNECFSKDIVLQFINRMSSGHAFVLLTITQLVAKVEEKTLVLLDEPESHLHPPLLSAFIRTLSELLDNRNAIAIVATHSPVVLQEIPKSCIWKIVRTGIETKAYRLVTETFGENIGILTREVFGLEVEKSGFHKLLNESVNKGGTYESILESYNYQLGKEGKLILKTLIRLRDEKNQGFFYYDKD